MTRLRNMMLDELERRNYARTSRLSSLILRIARASPAPVGPSAYSRSPNRPTKLPDSTRINGFALRQEIRRRR